MNRGRRGYEMLLRIKQIYRRNRAQRMNKKRKKQR